jgi:hypothetical protein
MIKNYRRVDSSELLRAVIKARYPFETLEPLCRASDAFGLICTRPKHHDGPHVAHGSSDQPIAMWETEP